MARLGLLARGAVGEVGSAAGATGGYLGVATLNEVYSGTYNPYKIMKIYLSPINLTIAWTCPVRSQGMLPQSLLLWLW